MFWNSFSVSARTGQGEFSKAALIRGISSRVAPASTALSQIIVYIPAAFGSASSMTFWSKNTEASFWPL